MSKTKINYESMFKAEPFPMMLLTRDFVIVAVNDALLQASGRRREELLDRNVFDALSAHSPGSGPGENLALRASLERVLATGERDTMALQKHGTPESGGSGTPEERYWSQINVPVLDEDGRVELIIHRAEEVTAFFRQLRQTTESDTTSTRAELEAMGSEVYARSRELQELNEELRTDRDQQRQVAATLREVVERQRQFVSDASHDLRNPVAAILLRLEDALADPEPDPRQVLYSLLQDAQRLNDLVSDLLELARLEVAAPAHARPVDLARLVTEELNRRPLTHQVSTRLDPQVIVNASPVRLTRLLGNLLTNADWHTNHQIQIFVTADPPDAVLEVLDDGPGIPPPERESIFERFYRSATSSRKDPSGTGLGLSISREIARTYGGHLYATDHPTGGGCLVLRLPLVPPKPVART